MSCSPGSAPGMRQLAAQGPVSSKTPSALQVWSLSAQAAGCKLAVQFLRYARTMEDRGSIDAMAFISVQTGLPLHELSCSEEEFSHPEHTTHTQVASKYSHLAVMQSV